MQHVVIALVFISSQTAHAEYGAPLELDTLSQEQLRKPIPCKEEDQAAEEFRDAIEESVILDDGEHDTSPSEDQEVDKEKEEECENFHYFASFHKEPRSIDIFYKQDAFNKITTEKSLDSKIDWSKIFGDDKKKKEKTSFNFEAIRQFFATLSFTAEVLLWSAFIAIVLFLALGLSRWLKNIDYRKGQNRAREEEPEAQLFASLKGERFDDLAERVKELIAQGDLRGACSLIYRANLKRLMDRGLAIHPDATELELLEHIQKQRISEDANASYLGILPGTLDYFRKATQTWRRLAYANIYPSEKALIALAESESTAWSQTELENKDTAVINSKELNNG